MPQRERRADRHHRADLELVDDANGVVLRRIVVGAMATNCWAVHATSSRHALLVDPGAEPERILAAVDDLTVGAIALTHAHFDHVLAVPHLVGALGVPVLAHPEDAPVWPHELATLAATGHFDAGTATGQLLADGHLLQPRRGERLWDGRHRPLVDGQLVHAGPLTARVLHTPGHTPGGISLSLAGHLVTGDTLFPGGPGLTGWPLSDFPTIMRSVRRLLSSADPETAIHPGHGSDTTVADERPDIESWQQRGW